MKSRGGAPPDASPGRNKPAIAPFRKGMEANVTSTKHRKSERPSDADLKRNPGIGTSKGKIRGPDLEPGENTFEGDVESDATPSGGIDPRRRGRSNE